MSLLLAVLQRLLSGAIPQLSGTRALTCSVSDLETPYRCRTECGLPISIVHCSSELLSSNDPPASASMTLGLQARATTPGGKLSLKSAV
uniref:Secreted protein n=1 Tax=Oryzias melastigma TaxID=30732 RepID=A0A3B3DPN6_ORYME